MVSRKTVLGRAAFTMMELIFAIVVISIAVITLPMMAQVTSKGIEENIVQEAIFAASAELMGATAYYWDLNSMQDNNLSNLERVIDIGGASCDADRLRPGHVNQLYHRRCLDSNATVVANTPDNTFPNLNNLTSRTLFENEAAAGSRDAGYKGSYDTNVTVTTTDDVKKITVSIINSDGDTITSLSTYSANIGEIDFYKRRF
ncbi:MAG: hypothetical protein WCZ70_07450 [Sulfurimonadaceae bacterium]